jgi:hypothetical protein
VKEREKLFDTIEELRAATFPDLDPQLVREILTVQIQFQEDRADGRRRTEQLVTRWASTHAASDAGATE